MRHIATQNIPNYYPVTMFECGPIAVVHDEVQYEHGRWYVECGGEGSYFMGMKEACDAFAKLVNFARCEALNAV